MDDKYAPVQPWKHNEDIMKIMNGSTATKASIVVGCARANPYPQGAMMLNGGQSAGNATPEIIYDTWEIKKEQSGEIKH